jgi:hypothetical protein
MTGIFYDKRISENTKKRQCASCGRIIKKDDIVEIIGFTRCGGITGHPSQRVFFCEGHMLPYIQKIQREFLLSKI